MRWILLCITHDFDPAMNEVSLKFHAELLHHAERPPVRRLGHGDYAIELKRLEARPAERRQGRTARLPGEISRHG